MVGVANVSTQPPLSVPASTIYLVRQCVRWIPAARGRERGGERGGSMILRILSICIAALLATPALASEPMEPSPGPGATVRRPDFAILRRLTVHYNLLVWPAGSTITVCFFSQSSDWRAVFVEAAAEWEQVANITFDAGPAPAYRDCDAAKPSDIRVRFVETSASGVTSGHSLIGTRSLAVPPGRPSLEVATRSSASGKARPKGSIKITLLHEIGHALGLPHAHQDPASRCLEDISLETVCATAARKSKVADAGRKRAEFYRQMARRADPVPAWDLGYDVSSIMHYSFNARILRAGGRSSCFKPATTVPGSLSEGDKARMAILYPKDPQAQRDFLLGQLAILRQSLKALGVSRATGERIAAIVVRDLGRRHPGLATAIDLSDLDLPASEQLAVEQALAQPDPPALPAECGLPEQQPAGK